MARVKICGMTHEEDIAGCVEAGVAALGFVVEYPLPTPWTLTRRRAAELMAGVPPFVSRVMVVGGDAATVLDLCHALHPDAVQLHHDEREEVVAEVAAGLAGTRTRIIKALRIRPRQPGVERDATPDAEQDAHHWTRVAQCFLDAGAHAILLDSKADHRPGGTGKTFDWSIARHVAQSIHPLILAGGLTPENVADAITTVNPFAVDVISSLEDAQHRKVKSQVAAFLHAVRRTSEPNAFGP